MITSQSNISHKLTREALHTFLLFASIIYAIAFAYCYVTKNMLSMYLLAGGMVIIVSSLFIIFKKEKKSC
jgi:fatty acid desaturase